MNRLFIVGNGFDIAHGLPTRYDDFLKHLTNEVLIKKEFPEENRIFFDERTIDKLIHEVNVNNRQRIYEEYSNRNISTCNFLNYIFRYTIKFINGTEPIRYSEWFNLEQEYYDELIRINERIAKPLETKLLHEFIYFLTSKLKEYITNLNYETIKKIHFYSELFFDGFYEKGTPLDKWIILNFNYTNTLNEVYKIDENKIVNIHGNAQKDDKIIIGYGDEMSPHYQNIERLNNNEYFKFLKSFYYSRNQNYSNLLNFIDIKEYEVILLGHSLGLSDRLLLNTLLEHKNCSRIRIVYYGNGKDNNFENLNMSLSRHFNDKQLLRKKLIAFDKDWRMHQYFE